MKIFIYKTLFVFLCLYLFFEFTFGIKIRDFEKKINNLHSSENLYFLKQKMRKEMNSAINKDVYLNPEDAKLISKFLNKVQKELNAAEDQ